MNKFIFFILVVVSMNSYAYITAYGYDSSETSKNNERLFNSLPKSTHIYPDSRGGYTWTDPGNPFSKNYIDRLPQQHSIYPDGRGGYYYDGGN